MQSELVRSLWSVVRSKDRPFFATDYGPRTTDYLTMLILLQLGPFVLFASGIAVLPLIAEHSWAKNRTKALVSVVLTIPAVVWLLAQGPVGREHLLHALGEYIQFILMLSALSPSPAFSWSMAICRPDRWGTRSGWRWARPG